MLPTGEIPLLDVKDSSAGKRYAIADLGFDLGDGNGAQTFSGVIELERRTMTAEDHLELGGDDEPVNGPKEPATPSRIGDGLASAVASAADAGDPARALDVIVAAKRPAVETATQQLERAIANGLVSTHADVEFQRGLIMAEKRAQVAADLEPLLDSITEEGAVVTSVLRHAHGFWIRVPADKVAAVAELPGIARLDLQTELVPDVNADGYSLDGDVISEIHQFEQAYAANYTGENGASAEIAFAMFDTEPVLTTHVGFYDTASPFTSRILGSLRCSNANCSDQWQQPGLGNNHGIAVAGILFGDLRDGQDPNIQQTFDRAKRSGFAPEAEGWIYTDAGGTLTNSLNWAWDHAVNRNPAPQIFVESISASALDENCEGEDAISLNANESLYENGVLLINSAGNTGGTGSASECTVNSPGSAIGTFTVGYHGGEDVISEGNNTYCDARAATINDGSAWGGSPTNYQEGKKRSIIDLTAYGPQEFRFCPNGDTDCLFSATSSAAPTVAAAAIDYIDMYKQIHSNFIDSPGVLYASLLMLSDRQGQAGPRLSSFDQRWGAGRLRLRLLGAGLDAPWWHYSLVTCIDHNEVYYLNVNGGNALPASVDTLRAVIWFYDRRHEMGIQIDDIDITLREIGNPTPLRTSANSYENKEMVYYSGVGNKAVRLEVAGDNVTTGGESCGANSMRVYIVLSVEDAARDDGDGPTWNAQNCEGVEPEL